MFKVSGLIGVLFFSGPLLALTTIDVLRASPASCRERISEIFKSEGVGSGASWSPSFPVNGIKSWQMPTREVGKWIIYQEAASLEVRRFEQSDLFDFVQQACPKTTEKRPAGEGQFFTDGDLEKLLQEKTAALIYAWSPDQWYSMKYWKWAQEIAAQERLRFVAVAKMNPVGGPVTNVPAKSKLLNASNELIMIGAMTHEPSVVVIDRGKISHVPIVGVFTKAIWKRRIQKARVDL